MNGADPSDASLADLRFVNAPHGWTLESSQRLEAPRENVFAFFADARNLETLTPGYLRFRLLTPTPIELRIGARIDYRLRVRGLPLRWTSEITDWRPPERFVDEQIHGPYRRWTHEHMFEESDGVTIVRDRVRYTVPGGAVIERLFVRPDLRRIFKYRRRRLVEIFSGEQRQARCS